MSQIAAQPDARIDRPIALVGLMGAGKTTVGRRLARALGLRFFDADREIERAADRSVVEIFSDFGEEAFRDGERKVIARLLDEGPCVIALGGGAFANDATRALIREKAVTVWLKADLDTLMERVSRRETRPLLLTGDPRQVMADLMAKREAAYRQADLTVDATSASHQATMKAIVAALEDAGVLS
ncbi:MULTISPECIES: shikimate kinase [Hyphobacterium]|uniref:Shikimate kinase n=1 Tax=Hyphobacterium vulgare TaxID=1736751 RepID=A0ABV6ZZ17_9PROT